VKISSVGIGVDILPVHLLHAIPLQQEFLYGSLPPEVDNAFSLPSS
jgi:hypothetical protein